MHILCTLYLNFNCISSINYNIALYKKINDTLSLKITSNPQCPHLGRLHCKKRFRETWELESALRTQYRQPSREPLSMAILHTSK